MRNYKYSLDTSSKKFTCPKCEKKTFVRFVETETQVYLSDDLGRCDRESNCGYFNVPSNSIILKKERIIDYVETSFHSLQLVENGLLSKRNNNFIKFLNDNFSEEAVKEVVLKYLISTSAHWDGATVFWQIDNYECVHAGKILQYNSENGKRLKEKGKVLIDWVHSVLKRKGVISEFNLRQCLFGLHLIKGSNVKVIGLVESEKTAVLMSLFKPEYIWMATGSKSGFKYELLLPIKEYGIVAFPDKSEYNDWSKRAIELNGFGFKITVNDWLEKGSFLDGTDLADVYIDELKTYNLLYKNIKTPSSNLIG